MERMPGPIVHKMCAPFLGIALVQYISSSDK